MKFTHTKYVKYLENINNILQTKTRKNKNAKVKWKEKKSVASAIPNILVMLLFEIIFHKLINVSCIKLFNL